jgi:flagella basal body P-ring formation protein FlgA
MNSSRPLTPFLVSLLLGLGSIFAAPVMRAQSSTTEELPVAELRSALLGNVAAQLTAHFRVEGDLQLESLRPLHLPASPAPLMVEVLEFPATLASSMILRIRAGSGENADHTLVVRAQLFREVWATRAPTERDAGFDASELETRRVDALRERDAISTAELCRDYRFSRPVPANRILTWRDVSRRPLVRKGQVIEVAAVDGPLSITMKALAMENGAAGETVKVRNLDSKKEFNALVVADSRAQVRF